MKHLLESSLLKNSKYILLFIMTLFMCDTMHAQDQTRAMKKSTFIGLNAGYAFLNNDNVFPVASFAWGQTRISESNIVLEYELGLAFPTIVSGKIGIGGKLGPLNLTVGVRPFPLNAYFQIAQSDGIRGNILISFEKDISALYKTQVFSRDHQTSLLGNINIGYRWNLN